MTLMTPKIYQETSRVLGISFIILVSLVYFFLDPFGSSFVEIAGWGIWWASVIVAFFVFPVLALRGVFLVRHLERDERKKVFQTIWLNVFCFVVSLMSFVWMVTLPISDLN